MSNERAKLDGAVVKSLTNVLDEIQFIRETGTGNNDALGTLALHLDQAAKCVTKLREFQLGGR